MGKYKITDEMLQDIEYYAEDQYSLDDMFDKLNISKKLMKDEQILNAYERGLVKHYILMASSGISNNEILKDDCITMEQCSLWKEKYSVEIAEGIKKSKKQIKTNTKNIDDPLTLGIKNILAQSKNDASGDEVSTQIIADDIRDIVKKLQEGDSTAILVTLVSNTMQLQECGNAIAFNMSGRAGSTLNNWEILNKMQMRVMSETRKNTMAINEICNPKRTTFIKEANQHNHNHLEKPKNKIENQNELQKTEQLEAPVVVTDAEIIPLKERVKC